ncbi:MAG TPA: DinB family protein [Thermoanaerobaculia bacterium]|nr:DinB family protein [Thermoanaerobaculia bacterium]
MTEANIGGIGGSGADFGHALLAEAKRRLLGESVPRLQKCLGLLSEEEIWRHPNVETPSVGNLVLHLQGNVRQYIVSGLGGAPDQRQRSKEFAETGPLPTAELLSRLDALMAEVEATLDRVDPESLLAKRRVQGFDESGLSILVHVVEHFSYHVGQITYVVKSRQAVDLQYYAGKDLNATS